MIVPFLLVKMIAVCIYLHFIVLPPVAQIDTIDPVLLNGMVSLVCRGFGAPNITYEWCDPDNNVVSDNNMYNFTITDIKQYGYYTCKVTNPDGSGSSRVEVEEPGL